MDIEILHMRMLHVEHNGAWYSFEHHSACCSMVHVAASYSAAQKRNRGFHQAIVARRAAVLCPFCGPLKQGPGPTEHRSLRTRSGFEIASRSPGCFSGCRWDAGWDAPWYKHPGMLCGPVQAIVLGCIPGCKWYNIPGCFWDVFGMQVGCVGSLGGATATSAKKSGGGDGGAGGRRPPAAAAGGSEICTRREASRATVRVASGAQRRLQVICTSAPGKKPM